MTHTTNNNSIRDIIFTILNATTTTTPQPYYGPFSGTIRLSRGQKRTPGLYGARED